MQFRSLLNPHQVKKRNQKNAMTAAGQFAHLMLEILFLLFGFLHLFFWQELSASWEFSLTLKQMDVGLNIFLFVICVPEIRRNLFQWG